MSLAEYDSSVDEMIADVVARRQEREDKLAKESAGIVPKAIYVVEADNTRIRGAEPRPGAIWRTLANLCKVSPDTIGVCTNTKDVLAVLVEES